MDQQFIKCPKCGTQIEITKAFTSQLEEKLRGEYHLKLEGEKKQIEQRFAKQAEEKFSFELRDLKSQLQEKEAKIKQAQDNELALRQRQRELEEREKNIEQQTEKLKQEYHQKYLAEKTKLEERIRKETQDNIGIELKEEIPGIAICFISSISSVLVR